MLKKLLTSSESKAYSLIELLIVLSTILIFLMLALPKLSFVNRFVLQNEIDRLFSTFSYLQYKAIALNEDQELIFDLENSGYLFLGKDGNDLFYKFPDLVNFGFLTNIFGPPSKPNKIIKKAVSFSRLKNKKFRVLFFSDGKISPGLVYLIDKSCRYFMCLSCPVSPFSCIRKYKYENNKWLSLK